MASSNVEAVPALVSTATVSAAGAVRLRVEAVAL